MQDIKPGGDTGRPLNVQKRLALMQAHGELRGRRILDCGCGAGGDRGERFPGLRAVGGVSQFIVAVKPEDRVSA